MASYVVKLLRELIRAKSETGNEYEAAMIVKREMDAIGMKTEVYEFAKGRPNVVGILRGKNPRGRKLLLTTHIDTVPAGGGWKHDPFGAEIDNGKIYGRGSTDSKCNVAICLEAARRIVESDTNLNGDLIIAITSDEETGSKFGLKPLLENKILNHTHAVIIDSHGFDVTIVQKGLVHFRVIVYGKKAHGAYPWLGDNAIDKATEIICNLRNYRFSFKKHKLIKSPTMSMGTIKGGDKVNIVPDHCEFEVDLRYLPGMDSKKIMNDFRKVIEKTTKRYNIEIMDEQKPYEISSKDHLVKTLFETLRKYGKNSRIKGSEGATPVSFFKSDAVSTGFGEPGVAHMTDEFVKISDLEDGSRALEDFIKEFLK